MKAEPFAKYPPCSERDVEFGLFVTTCGYSKVYAGNKYPPKKEHPSLYLFDWEKGRILNDYQIIYITRGEGLFESSGIRLRKIEAGTMILIFPGEWHRYRPLPETGWDEYWIGFKGPAASQFEKKRFITRKQPLLNIGIHDRIVEKYLYVCHIVEEEKPGFQQIAAGETWALIGLITSIMNHNNFENTETEKIVRASKVLFFENLSTNISPEEVAERLNIGYSRFRKVFKQYTGLAPGQYLIHLKIQKAKELAAASEMTFKEISEELGFDNNFYFSKLFKEKTGLSPLQFRQMMKGNQK